MSEFVSGNFLITTRLEGMLLSDSSLFLGPSEFNRKNLGDTPFTTFAYYISPERLYQGAYP